MNFSKIRSKILKKKEQTSPGIVFVTEAEVGKVTPTLSRLVSDDVERSVQICDEKAVGMEKSERSLVKSMNVNGVLCIEELSHCWRCGLRGTEMELEEHDSDCFYSSPESVSCPSNLAQEFATKHSLSPGGINDLYTLLYHFQHAAQLLFLVFFY